MPQLDLAYFPSQIFWLTLSFVLLYWFLSRSGLPRLAAIFEARRKLTQGRREAAAKAAEEAQTILTQCEEDLASAREQARKKAAALREESAASLSKAEAQAKQVAAQKIAASRDESAELLAASRNTVEAVAVAITGEVLSHLGGVRASNEEIAQAVQIAAGEG